MSATSSRNGDRWQYRDATACECGIWKGENSQRDLKNVSSPSHAATAAAARVRLQWRTLFGIMRSDVWHLCDAQGSDVALLAFAKKILNTLNFWTARKDGEDGEKKKRQTERERNRDR